MANLPETSAWEPGIHQLEESDRAKAGPGGILNIPPWQLANRTRYLKEQLDAYNGLLKSGELPFSNINSALSAVTAGKVPEEPCYQLDLIILFFGSMNIKMLQENSYLPGNIYLQIY